LRRLESMMPYSYWEPFTYTSPPPPSAGFSSHTSTVDEAGPRQLSLP
jgi:hypothetical protein